MVYFKDNPDYSPDDFMRDLQAFHEVNSWEAGIYAREQYENVLRLLEGKVTKSNQDAEMIELLRRILKGFEIFVEAAKIIRDFIEGVLKKNINSVEIGPKNLLQHIKVQGTTHVEAETNFFKTEWSADFVHGPDTLMFILELAKSILQPGEKITEINRITFRRPITHNVRLIIEDVSSPVAPGTLDGVLIDGELVTSRSGRVLRFFAKKIPDSPVQSQIEVNPFAQSVFCGCADHHRVFGDVHSFALNPNALSPEIMNSLGNVPSMLAATMADLITTALSMICHPNQHEPRPDHLRLLLGLKKLQLPEGIDALLPNDGQLVIQMRPDKTRPGKSRFLLTPFEFRFPHQTTSGEGVIAISDSAEKSDDYLRRCSEN